MDEIILQTNEIRAVFTPRAGAALRSLCAIRNGTEIEFIVGGEGPHDPENVPHGTGCFIMVPWPNRIRDGRLIVGGRKYMLPLNSGPHAMHGIMREKEFAADITATDCSSNPTACRMSAELGPPWPFKGTVYMDASVEGRSLIQTLTVEAAPGENPFPIGFGWHPWFNRNLGGGDPGIKANVTGEWITTEDMTATGEMVKPARENELRSGLVPEVDSLDGCFSIEQESPVVISWPEAALKIESSPTVSHLMIYTPEHAICAEPQTCTIDAFKYHRLGIQDTGTFFVSPGNPLVGRTVWTWS